MFKQNFVSLSLVFCWLIVISEAQRTPRPTPCVVPNVKHGRLFTTASLLPAGRLVQPGAEVRLQCFEGYTYNNYQTDAFLCDNAGTWDPPMGDPPCRAIAGCWDTWIPWQRHGFIQQPKQTVKVPVNTVRQILCNCGYVINGSSTVQCGEDGEWTKPGICSYSEQAVFSTHRELFNYSISGNIGRFQNIIDQKCPVDPNWLNPIRLCPADPDLCIANLTLLHGIGFYCERLTNKPEMGLNAVRMVRRLLALGANANLAEMERNVTVLMLVSSQCKETNTSAETKLIVKSIIDATADLNQRESKFGMTALMMAAQNCRTSAVRMMLEEGATINLTSNAASNWSAIHYAITANCSYTTARVLLNFGMIARQADANNVTLLMLAAEQDNVETLGLLLERGAELDSTDGTGATALIRAARAGRENAAAFLRQQGAKRDGCTLELCRDPTTTTTTTEDPFGDY